MSELRKNKCHALLIGVGQRQEDSPAIAVTADDALRLGENLSTYCSFSQANIVTLTNSNASKTNIINALDEIVKHTEKEKADLVIVFYSGHGCRSANDFYLINHDVDINNISKTAMNGNDFVKKLNAIKSERLLILLNCCHAGAINKNGLSSTDIPFKKEDILDNGYNRAILTACPSNTVAFTGKPLSPFVFSLIEGLTGAECNEEDKKVHLFDLALYVRERTFIKTRLSQRTGFEILDNGRISNFLIADFTNGIPKPNPMEQEKFSLLDSNLEEIIEIPTRGDNNFEINKMKEEFKNQYGWVKNAVINSTITAEGNVQIGDNVINVDGNGNIIIQNAQNSPIVINKDSNSREIIEQLEVLNLKIEELTDSLIRSGNGQNPIIATMNGINRSNLENFKKELKDLIDQKGFLGIAEVFEKIEKSKFYYYPATLTGLRNQSTEPLTQLMPGNYLVGVKTFIQSLK